MAKKTIRLISWNVNGLRAVMKKDFIKSVNKIDGDIIALQETKLQEHQRTDEMMNLDGYQSHWSYASSKKGYSGVATYSRIQPDHVKTGIGIDRYDNEGRILEMDFKDFVFLMSIFQTAQ